MAVDGSQERVYSIHELAQLAGVSVRTLHHYDSIGLLVPARQTNGYRLYGPAEVQRLQLIMLYRATGMKLRDVGTCLEAPDANVADLLRAQLGELTRQRDDLDRLIDTVRKTIADIGGEGSGTMDDAEKFEGFKHGLIAKNEKEYGQEARARYGDEAMDASNAKLAGMTRTQYDGVCELEQRIDDGLRKAMATSDPAGLEAQEVCDLHRQWLCAFWKDGAYSKEAHAGMAEMYMADERFKAHYDQIAPGAAQFLHDALMVYCGKR